MRTIPECLESILGPEDIGLTRIQQFTIMSVCLSIFQTLQGAFYQHGCDINQLDVLAELLSMDRAQVGDKLQASEYIDAVRENFALASSLSAHGLPNLHMGTGEGFKLLYGGYITAEFLVPAIEGRDSPNAKGNLLSHHLLRVTKVSVSLLLG